MGYIQSMGSQNVRHDGETNTTLWASQVALGVKNLPASAGDVSKENENTRVVVVAQSLSPV